MEIVVFWINEEHRTRYHKVHKNLKYILSNLLKRLEKSANPRFRLENAEWYREVVTAMSRTVGFDLTTPPKGCVSFNESQPLWTVVASFRKWVGGARSVVPNTGSTLESPAVLLKHQSQSPTPDQMKTKSLGVGPRHL